MTHGLPTAFLTKTHVTDTCWLWAGAVQSSGYGSFGADGRTHLAHRFAYEALNGSIPDGMSIDHLCRNKLCVNPAHMEPVTLAENVRRADKASGRTSVCSKGHPLTQHPSKPQQWCRTCNNERHAAYQRRRYAEARRAGVA